MSPSASAKGYAAVRAHLIRQGRVLLGQSGGRGLWTTFGGKPEPGECLEDTLKRELREELGIRPTEFTRLPDRERDWDGRAARVAVFVVLDWHGEPRNLAPHEHVSIRWFSAGELESASLQEAAREEAVSLLVGLHAPRPHREGEDMRSHPRREQRVGELKPAVTAASPDAVFPARVGTPESGGVGVPPGPSFSPWGVGRPTQEPANDNTGSAL